MIQKSTAIILFILGLILGGAAVWSYNSFYAGPQLVAETQTAAKTQFEAEQIRKQNSLVATITAIEGDTISATTQNNDLEQTITIKVGAATQISAVSNDDSSTQINISIADLTPGVRILVAAAGPIDANQTIYAEKIIKL